MKKTTFLIALLVLPFLTIAQGPWEFNGTEDGWVKGGGCTAATSPTAWVLTTNGGNNPNLSIETAGVDADTNVYAAVTIRLSAGGPTLMRVRIPKDDGSGFVYKPTVVDPSQTDFVTYYVNVTDANWSGTENNIRIQFKDDNGANSGANHTSTGETIEIDRIEFISVVPATVQNSYTFDSSVEGWDVTTRSSVSAENGNLRVQLNGNGAVPDSNNSKVALNTFFAINATGNPYLHITMQNQSNDDQIKIVYPNTIDGGNVTVTQIVSTNDTEFVTYDFDLGANPNWTGEINDIELVFDDSEAQEGNGIFLIDSIVVDNILSVDENTSTTFKISPNPATTVVNIDGITDISTVELYDITGKKVMHTNQLINNQLNIESFKSGIYLLKIKDTNNKSTVMKLIIE